MCLLPLWLIVVIIFDQASADFHDQAFFASVRSDLADLNPVQEADQINEALRTYWVSTDSEGNLSGRISAIDAERAGVFPLAKLEVVLLRNGMVQRKTEATDEQGQFTLLDVEPGPYSLVAAGPNGFMAYSINVLRQLAPLDTNPDQTSRLPLQPAAPQFVSFSKSVPAIVLGQEKFQVDAAAIPPTFLEVERIISGYLPSDVELSLNSLGQSNDGKPMELLKSTSGFKFPLNQDGSFTGRVLPPAGDEEQIELSDMNVFLLQDDIEMHRVDVDKDGKFRIEAVDPGVYAVVAAGKEGFAALSFEFVSADDALGANSEQQVPEEQYVSLTQPQADLMPGIALIVDPEDIKYCRQKLKELVGRQEELVAQDQLPYYDQGIQYLQPGSAGVPFTDGGLPATTGRSATGARFSAGSSVGLRRALFLGAAIALPIALGGQESTPMTPSQTE